MDFEGRIARLQERIAEDGVEALLVTNLVNVRYLTGFSGTNGQLVVTSSGATFFSDPRYDARARELVRGADVVIYRARLSEVLPDRLAVDSVTRLGVEAETMTVAGRDRLAERMEGIELVATKAVVEDLRRAKESAELAEIKAAVAIGDETFAWALDHLRPGLTEREVALELEVHMRRVGADGVSFEPIVGSGPLSAHIHHTPSERVLETGDLVLLDFGCKVNGYCSDLTRTVVVGAATAEQRAVYELVLAAQERGVAAIRAGASGVAADAAARAVIEDAGRSEQFGHGLGHGVGLDVHEAPRLHYTSEDTLTAGDVVTAEPGLYVQGWGGVRIEDCVLVGDGGAEVLGGAPKDKLVEL